MVKRIIFLIKFYYIILVTITVYLCYYYHFIIKNIVDAKNNDNFIIVGSIIFFSLSILSVFSACVGEFSPLRIFLRKSAENIKIIDLSLEIFVEWNSSIKRGILSRTVPPLKVQLSIVITIHERSNVNIIYYIFVTFAL